MDEEDVGSKGKEKTTDFSPSPFHFPITFSHLFVQSFSLILFISLFLSLIPSI